MERRAGGVIAAHKSFVHFATTRKLLNINQDFFLAFCYANLILSNFHRVRGNFSLFVFPPLTLHPRSLSIPPLYFALSRLLFNVLSYFIAIFFLVSSLLLD